MPYLLLSFKLQQRSTVSDQENGEKRRRKKVEWLQTLAFSSSKSEYLLHTVQLLVRVHTSSTYTCIWFTSPNEKEKRKERKSKEEE